MKERRALVDGLKTGSNVDRTLEEQFVFANKAKESRSAPAPEGDEPRKGKGTGSAVSRVPLTTRIRSDFAAALKRASLERQLSGTFPNTLQDILEEALEPWLRTNGHLS